MKFLKAVVMHGVQYRQTQLLGKKKGEEIMSLKWDKKIVSRRSFIKYVGGSVVATAMSPSFPSIVLAKPKMIKIAYVEALSGASALQGQDHVRGLKFAVEEINAAGGIKSLGGAKIELIGGDSETNPTVGIQVAERLARQKPVIMIGCENSSVTYPVTQVAEREGINFIVDIAMADKITARGFKFVFRFFATGEQACSKQGEHIKMMSDKYRIDIKTVALLHENTLFGNSVSETLAKVLPKAGLEIIANIPYDHDTTSLDTEIAKIKQLNPDALLPTSYIPGAILMTKTMKAFDFSPKLYMGGYSAGHSLPGYIKGIGELSKYTMNDGNANPWRTHPEYQKKNKKYQKRFPGFKLNRTAAFSYLALKVGADALERCGSTDPDVLNKAIRDTHFEHHIVTTPAINFDETGQMPNTSGVTEQILQPELLRATNVWPLEFAPKGVKPVVPFPSWKKRG